MATKPSEDSNADLLAREAVREHLRRAGRKGGQTMKKRGRAYYQAIGKKGATARWGKKKKNNGKRTTA